jgi:hypothetical protein
VSSVAGRWMMGLCLEPGKIFESFGRSDEELVLHSDSQEAAAVGAFFLYFFIFFFWLLQDTNLYEEVGRREGGQRNGRDITLRPGPG